MTEKEFYDRIHDLKNENAKLLVQLDRKYNLQKYGSSQEVEVSNFGSIRSAYRRSVLHCVFFTLDIDIFFSSFIFILFSQIVDEGYHDSSDDVDPFPPTVVTAKNMSVFYYTV